MYATLSKLAAAGLIAAALLIAAPGRAEALSPGSGYVCSVYYSPYASSGGDHGNLSVSFYSQPGCAGSYLGNGKMLTVGSSHPGVAREFLLGEQALLASATMLQRAAALDQKVFWSVPNAAPTIIWCIRFYSGSKR